jgi:hypothetical protein
MHRAVKDDAFNGVMDKIAKADALMRDCLAAFFENKRNIILIRDNGKNRFFILFDELCLIKKANI